MPDFVTVSSSEDSCTNLLNWFNMINGVHTHIHVITCVCVTHACVRAYAHTHTHTHTHKHILQKLASVVHHQALYTYLD